MTKSSCFLSSLLDAKKRNVIVSVYASPDDGEVHSTGFVLDATCDELSIKHLTSDGAPDGIVLLRMDSVYQIDINGRYEKRVAFLAKHYTEVFE